MEYDSDDIQSVVFIEPETNNVIIKITGFPNKDLANLYVSWDYVMSYPLTLLL
jgi:hypothetical protein